MPIEKAIKLGFVGPGLFLTFKIIGIIKNEIDDDSKCYG